MILSKEKLIEQLTKDRKAGKKIVAVSGGFDPIHPGHISHIVEASKLGDVLVVILNCDRFLISKKGKPFIPATDRADIVDSIKGVDYVYIFETDSYTVDKALEDIKPDIFAKGGDRIDKESIPEWDTCIKNSIKLVPNVGAEKKWSSRNYLKDWEEFVKDNSSYS